MNRNSITRLSTVALGLVLSSAAFATNYFFDDFSSNPATGPVQSTTVWGIDRYAPAAFDSQVFDGDTRLRIGINAADGLQTRPLAYQSSFYNTQGRGLNLGNPYNSSISADLYIDPAWKTIRARSDMWAVMGDATNSISGYPILGFTSANKLDPFNPDSLAAPKQPRFRYFSQAPYPSGGWVELGLPPGFTYGRWYRLELRCTPFTVEARIDGRLMHAEALPYGTVGFNAMIMQAYNFGDYDNSATYQIGDTYNAYWDNLRVGPVGSIGLPVDLTGDYRMPHTGMATVHTDGTLDQVDEGSAVEGTFTPFSAIKPPTNLKANLLGRSFKTEIDISGADFAANSKYQLGTNEVQINVLPGGFFGLNAITPVLVSSTVKRYAIDASVDGFGAATVTVTPEGGSPVVIGTTAPGVVTGNPLAFGVRATSTANGGTSQMEVLSFTTDAVPNALYAYAPLPWIKPLTPYTWGIGAASLAQATFGYQLATVPSGGQTLTNLNYVGSVPDYYSRATFDQVFLDPRTAGYLAAGAPFGGPGVTGSHPLAQLPFAGVASEGTATMGIGPNLGDSQLPTQFSGSLGAPVGALRHPSNTMVFDATPPSLTLVSATQGLTNVVSNPVILGSLVVKVDAKDLGASPSGLASYPKVRFDFSPVDNYGPEDVTVTMGAESGNQFTASTIIPPNTPNGPAKIVVEGADRANNLASFTQPINVNNTQITVNLSLTSVSASVNRWVQFVVGGSTGSNPAITIDRVVPFTAGSATVVLNAFDGLPVTNNLTAISAKDPLHTLRTKVALGGTPNQYTATIALKSGNANNDNVIDILDYGVFAITWNPIVNIGANTTIGQAGPHADFNASGFVDTGDYTFIQFNFLSVGDSPVGNFLRQEPPKTKCTPRELATAAKVSLKVAAMMDANEDGWITTTEISNWLKRRQR